MLSPIFLCMFVAYYIEKISGFRYAMLIAIFIGIITGYNMVYKLIKSILEKDAFDEKEERQIKQKSNKKYTYKPKIPSRIKKESLDG